MRKLDQVGSFLRPAKLKTARVDFANGKINAEQLRVIENECIKDLLKKCDENNLYYLTDGEFKRSWFHLDFFWGFKGVEKIIKEKGYIFKGIETRAEGAKITGKIECVNHPFIANFKDLIQTAKELGIDTNRLKITIPSPAMFLHTLFTRASNNAVIEYYENDYEAIKKDILKAYDDFYKEFYAIGGRYIHLDDVSFGSFCDAGLRADLENGGENPAKIVDEYVDYLNESIKNLPKDLITSIHVCKGNYRSRYYASGGYEFVAKKLFKELNVDKFFLEFDDDRSGDFTPLRFIKNQTVVLGLLTTKVEANPSLETLKARAAEAAKIISPKQIEFSTQCGFSSTEEGNEISEETQWQKIRLLNELNASLEAEGFFN